MVIVGEQKVKNLDISFHFSLVIAKGYNLSFFNKRRLHRSYFYFHTFHGNFWWFGLIIQIIFILLSWQALEIEQKALVIDLIQLQRHLDEMLRYVFVTGHATTNMNVVWVDHLPFLKIFINQMINKFRHRCKNCLTKSRVFMALQTSFMISCGLLCDRIPKCHLARLVGLPRCTFSAFIPASLARSSNAENIKYIII